MATTQTRWGTGVNAEAIQAWDGPLFDRFVQFRDILVAGLGAHGDEALRLNPPQEGQRVLDIGCGFGDTTQQIAAMVGPSGEAAGVDAAKNFIDASIGEAAEAGVENARFFVGDVQVDDLGGPYDAAFSRMGTMFFSARSPPCGTCAGRSTRRTADDGGVAPARGQRVAVPRAAGRRGDREPARGVRRADLRPRALLHGECRHRHAQLIAAGYEDISLRRCDLPIKGGNDIDEALEIVTSIGPAGEILRLLGDRAQEHLPKVDAALREAFKEFQREDGSIWGMASTWIVTATAPETA